MAKYPWFSEIAPGYRVIKCDRDPVSVDVWVIRERDGRTIYQSHQPTEWHASRWLAEVRRELTKEN